MIIMKLKIMKLGIIFLGSLLFQISFAHSQTFVVSNLGEEPVDDNNIVPESGYWPAISFHTGSEASTLAGLVVRLQFFGGGDSVSIYNNVLTNSVNQPGTSYATFQDDYEDLGSDQLRFTPNGDVSLSAMTTYWLVFSTTGDYDIGYTRSTAETSDSGWSIGDTVMWSENGEDPWMPDTNVGPVQFGIIIPESTHHAFVGGCLLIVFVAFLRIRRMRFAANR